MGGSDLGSRTLVVSGDVVYYQFQSMELEHGRAGQVEIPFLFKEKYKPRQTKNHMGW